MFLEPVSFRIAEPINYTIPALMYGTQFAEEGLVKCNIKKYDYNKFYSAWKCPRIVVEDAVKNFSHMYIVLRMTLCCC